MSLYHKLLEDIKRHEGCKKNKKGRHVLYRCPAYKITCGYGRNVDENGFSEDEVELMLKNDIRDATTSAIKIFPKFSTYTQNRQHAFINMIFNLGVPRFMGFKNMVKAARSGDWEKAAHEAEDSKWFREDVGIRGPEIVAMLRDR